MYVPPRFAATIPRAPGANCTRPYRFSKRGSMIFPAGSGGSATRQFSIRMPFWPSRRIGRPTDTPVQAGLAPILPHEISRPAGRAQPSRRPGRAASGPRQDKGRDSDGTAGEEVASRVERLV